MDRSRSPQAVGGGSLRAWLSQWAWGTCGAADVVRNAATYVADHEPREVDRRVLRLANTAYNIGNAERVIESIVESDRLPATTRVEASLMHEVCLPFTLFHWLRTHNARKFATHLGAQPEGIKAWWEQYFSSDAGREHRRLHPWLRGKTATDLQWHLPLQLFDDAGPVSHTGSTSVRCWFSLLGHGGDKETRFLIGTAMKGDDVPDKSWEPILASFEELARPVAAGNWGAILLFVGCDLEYACNVLGLPHFNSPANACADCRANLTDMPVNNFHATAPWRATRKTNREYLASLRVPKHPLVAHPWFSRYSFRHDLLHMVDHHGVCSHVIGNVLAAHLFGEREGEVLPGRNVEDRLAFLNADIATFYTMRRVQNRLPPLKEANLKADGFPELHGPGVKAANTRALLPYVVELQGRAVTAIGTRRQKHMLKVAESLQEATKTFYRAGSFLTTDEIVYVNKHLTRLGQHYQQLQVLDLAEGRCTWKTTTKLHYVAAHLGEQAMLINPVVVQGYRSESMVGEICRIYAESQNGPFRARVQRVALLKYRVGLHMLWD